MSEPDPQIVRECAQQAMAEMAFRYDAVGSVLDARGLSYDEYAAAVVAHIDAATVQVSWPDEQPQDERDARIAGLEREVRQLRAGAPRAWKQDWHDPIARFETFVNVTRSYDSDHLGGIMRGGNAEATITLGDLRAVLARLAELEAAQDERDGDVRAVARLLASADGSITEMFAAHEALEARFADRIAALDARDATEAGR